MKAAEAGAFWDLTGKLDKYPNLKPANEQTAKNTQINGKTYGIYRVRPLLRSGIVIRKDWLAKLGLKEPQSVEDLYTIAKAFAEQGPGRQRQEGHLRPDHPEVAGQLRQRQPVRRDRDLVRRAERLG